MSLADPVRPSDEDGRLLALTRSGLLDPLSDEAYRSVSTLLRSVFDVPVALVTTVDGHRQRFKCAIGLDLPDMAREESLCHDVILSRRVLAIGNAETDPRFRTHPLVTGPMAIRFYLGAPLLSPEGYAIGSVCVIDRKPRAIDAHQITVIEDFADLVHEQSELLRIAERDALTGVSTRRAFLQAVAREMSRARRHGTPATIALFDMDRFKAINDTRGHRTGDAVLQTAANVCRETIHEEETIGRLGGEEFAVLFVDTDLAAGRAATEQLRAAVEQARSRLDPGLAFTASFGVAPLDDRMKTPEDWIEAADRALYRAKANGRNRVETA